MLQPSSSLRSEPFRQPAHLRVLLADDNELFAEALTTTLELDARLEIVGRARNGREAVELAAALHPDVLLMDVDMPILDGIDATRDVKRVSPGSRVLVLTASTAAEDRARALEAGATAYLPKGGSAAELFDTIFCVAATEGSAPRSEPRAPRRARRRLRLALPTSRALRAFR
jgi:DNA-binding NarL/FixJ family response regulator